MPMLRRKRIKPVDGEMTILEHLVEFRRRLFYMAMGILAGTIVGFIWFGHSVPVIGLPSLADILTGPYCAVPASSRVAFGAEESCRLLATGPFSALELQLKSALIAGAVLTSPIWLHHVWAFVTPALHTRERRYTIVFAVIGSALFSLGAVLAYIVIQEGLTVLLGFGGDATIAALSPDSYFSFLIAMLVIFGVSFELPLLLIMMNQVGVISHRQLSSCRRYAIFALVVFAGLIVPGNDPVTMGALAGALVVFYELSVQVARIHDRRLAKRTAAAEIADDQPSRI